MNTKDDLIYVGVAVGVILAVLAIIYGAILPISRSKAYIGAISTVSSVKTTQEFKDKFRPVLEHISPIGDEEIPKFLSNDILSIISQNNNEEVRRELIDFIEPYLQKNNVRHLLALAQLYGLMWQSYNKEADFAKAEQYLLEARSIGPKLPPVLYTLLNLYQAKNDKARIKEVAETILKYWPEDEQTKKLITG